MKIAIVCGHFVPDMGYVEVHLANAFHNLGHTVTVITSNKTSFSSAHNNIENSNAQLPYSIVRLAPYFNYGQLIMAKGIVREIYKFEPEKVFVIGLGKIFPKKVFKIKHKNFELITLLGDNEDTYNKSIKGLKRRFLQRFFKTPVYNLAIKNSDWLVGYTPSTKEVVNSFIKEDLQYTLNNKYQLSTLGFDVKEFYCANPQSVQLRSDLKIDASTKVIITATRVTAAKKLEKNIDAIASLTKKGVNVTYLLIGFGADEYSVKLKNYIADKKLGNAILTFPFMDRLEMVKYYNLANIGLWTQTAISIFEALGTGLFLLLPQKNNVSHILNSETGKYYTDKTLFTTLAESVEKVADNDLNRIKLAEQSATQFSFKSIANKLIEL